MRWDAQDCRESRREVWLSCFLGSHGGCIWVRVVIWTGVQEQPLPASPGACSAPAVTPADAQGKARSRQAHVVPCSLNLSITKYFQRWRFPQPDVVYLDAKSSLVQVFTCHPLKAPKIPFLKGCAATHPLARRLAHPLATTWVNCSCVNLAATVIPKSSRAWHAPRPLPLLVPSRPVPSPPGGAGAGARVLPSARGRNTVQARCVPGAVLAAFSHAPQAGPASYGHAHRGQ